MFYHVSNVLAIDIIAINRQLHYFRLPSYLEIHKGEREVLQLVLSFVNGIAVIYKAG